MISSLYCSWLILNDPTISDTNRKYLALAASLVIQGHHGSLKSRTNYVKNLDYFSDNEIFSRQVEALENNIEEIEHITTKDLGLKGFKEFINCWQDHLYNFNRNIILLGKFSFVDPKEPYFMINLLYSALLDADISDAGGIIQPARLEIDPNIIKGYIVSLHSNDDTTEIKKYTFLSYR